VSSVASTVKISYVARDLGNLGDATSGPSIAAAVNNRGLVVGTTRQADGFERAFRWDPATGKMTDLGTLGGRTSQGAGVNARDGLSETQRPRTSTAMPSSGIPPLDG